MTTTLEPMPTEIDLAGNLEFPCDVERLDNGHTLITDAGDETGVGSEVIAVNRRGDVVWRFGDGLAFAHCARRLDNGHTLIADTTHDRLVEITPDGEIAWTSDDWGDGDGVLSDGSHLHYPNDVHVLDYGRLLVTDRNNNRAIVVTRDGRVEWGYDRGLSHPHNADPLDNGNVLLVDSDGGRVLEVDPAGEVVWRYEGEGEAALNFPRDADRMGNGNTLITDSRHHRVIEVDPAGEIV